MTTTHTPTLKEILMPKRVTTMQLIPGDVVATTKLFGGFVAPAPPGARGTAKTVEDIGIQPADRVSDPDRIVFFTDGSKCHVRSTRYWTVKEA